MNRREVYVLTIFVALSVRCVGCVANYNRNDFPTDFAFGSGTSAYQWEGAYDEDGKKPSVWDTYVHSRNMENGDIACDGYHKYKRHSDSPSLGLGLYPVNGRGPVNPKGLEFYKNFILELVTHGIEPHVTLYHYDHPQYLEDEYRGWLNRRIIKDFTAYADVCFREFGKHVKFWTTINEANIFTVGGYDGGNTPPGRCSTCMSGNSSTEPYIVAHNLLLAHASASRLYKQKYKDTQGGSVGFSIFTIGFRPSTNSKDDEMAIQRFKDFFYGWMLGPLTYGDYPEGMKRKLGTRLPVFTKEEAEQVKGSSDFVGVIHYLAATISNAEPKPLLPGDSAYFAEIGATLTYSGNFSGFEYEVAPWAMEVVLEYIKQSFGNPPVYILENGEPMKQDLQLQEKDTPRIEFLDAYIGAVLKAVRNGSDTRGYFVWSFMDLYELLSGYNFSFGLYSVNFSDPHRKRSPKLSAHWYSAFLKKGNTNFPGFQGTSHLQTNLSSSSLAASSYEQSTYALEWTLDRFFAPYAPNFPFKLLIIHAKPNAAVSAVGFAGLGIAEVVPHLDADLKHTAAKVVDKAKGICDSKSVHDATMEVFEGDARNILCEVVDKHHASLLVVGSHGHGAIKRAVIGSVSDYCAHHAHCSVMIVKKPKIKV
ncbi:hypothetical protein Bca101_080192 [Brassica carinata]